MGCEEQSEAQSGEFSWDGDEVECQGQPTATSLSGAARAIYEDSGSDNAWVSSSLLPCGWDLGEMLQVTACPPSAPGPRYAGFCSPDGCYGYNGRASALCRSAWWTIPPPMTLQDLRVSWPAWREWVSYKIVSQKVEERAGASGWGSANVAGYLVWLAFVAWNISPLGRI